MPGIFISYRRKDSLVWAGRLFDTLSLHFGGRMVFMDINGGIPRGANFERSLAGALEGCDALLALIGPQWLHLAGTDGRRRLDMADDWVRREIAGSLQRGIPVVPVLLGGAEMPAQVDLPADLQPLCKQQNAVLADTDWHDHVARLIEDLCRTTTLALVRPLRRDDVQSANSGIQLLADLLAQNAAVADAVSRSREVVENTHRRMGRLEVFKDLHDALHTVEFECLRPVAAAGPATTLVRFRLRFEAVAGRIRRRQAASDIDPDLVEELELGLAAVEQAFQRAAQQAQPGEPGYTLVTAALRDLLSGLPSQLDTGIRYTARELDLDRLVALMTTVHAVLPAADGDAALGTLVQGTAALQRLRDELAQRVNEHTGLQKLDAKLRAVCVGGLQAGALGAEWGRIRQLRGKLAQPLSNELLAAQAGLLEIEQLIEASCAAGREAEAFDLVVEYFQVVAGVFRDVDRALKDFSLRLAEVSRPLKTVLDLCMSSPR